MGYVAFRKKVCAGEGDSFSEAAGSPTPRSAALAPSSIFSSARLSMDVLVDLPFQSVYEHIATSNGQPQVSVEVNPGYLDVYQYFITLSHESISFHAA